MAQRRDLAEPATGPAKLRFYARGYALVPDYHAQESGARRFHGWKHDPQQGPEFEGEHRNPNGAVERRKERHGGFVRQTGEVHSIPSNSPFLGEYIRHLRDGDLWPADAETAAFVGRQFDPEFEGEHPAAVVNALDVALSGPRADAGLPTNMPAVDARLARERSAAAEEH